MSDAVTIQKGFPPEQRLAAARLYDAAFGAKLSIAIPEEALRLEVLREAFNPDFCFIALSGSELIGIAGFKTGVGALTKTSSFGYLRWLLGFGSATTLEYSLEVGSATGH